MKFTDYIFNKAEAIRWITDSEPVLHCSYCKYYDPQTNICEKNCWIPGLKSQWKHDSTVTALLE